MKKKAEKQKGALAMHHAQKSCGEHSRTPLFGVDLGLIAPLQPIRSVGQL
jgi:hypothetical protein